MVIKFLKIQNVPSVPSKVLCIHTRNLYTYDIIICNDILSGFCHNKKLHSCFLVYFTEKKYRRCASPLSFKQKTVTPAVSPLPCPSPAEPRARPPRGSPSPPPSLSPFVLPPVPALHEGAGGTSSVPAPRWRLLDKSSTCCGAFLGAVTQGGAWPGGGA